jgi:diguanylate cyclase (GGDEF)-like protein
VAERLRARLPEQVQTGPAEALLPITASFGIASYRPAEDLETFLARADHGMYKAKSLGRNRVEEEET